MNHDIAIIVVAALWLAEIAYWVWWWPRSISRQINRRAKAQGAKAGL